MRQPKFKVGDVVALNSSKNTVNMTISEVITEPIPTHPDSKQFNGTYNCLWFDYTQNLKTGIFKEEILSDAKLSMGNIGS